MRFSTIAAVLAAFSAAGFGYASLFSSSQTSNNDRVVTSWPTFVDGRRIVASKPEEKPTQLAALVTSPAVVGTRAEQPSKIVARLAKPVPKAVTATQKKADAVEVRSAAMKAWVEKRHVKSRNAPAIRNNNIVTGSIRSSAEAVAETRSLNSSAAKSVAVSPSVSEATTSPNTRQRQSQPRLALAKWRHTTPELPVRKDPNQTGLAGSRASVPPLPLKRPVIRQPKRYASHTVHPPKRPRFEPRLRSAEALQAPPPRIAPKPLLRKPKVSARKTRTARKRNVGARRAQYRARQRRIRALRRKQALRQQRLRARQARINRRKNRSRRFRSYRQYQAYRNRVIANQIRRQRYRRGIY
ncbi:MAG: hypothetical protein RIC14_03100 [Filomicrobium sp.]